MNEKNKQTRDCGKDKGRCGADKTIRLARYQHSVHVQGIRNSQVVCPAKRPQLMRRIGQQLTNNCPTQAGQGGQI